MTRPRMVQTLTSSTPNAFLSQEENIQILLLDTAEGKTFHGTYSLRFYLTLHWKEYALVDISQTTPSI